MQSKFPWTIEYPDDVTLTLSSKEVYIEFETKSVEEIVAFVKNNGLKPVEDDSPSFGLSLNNPDTNRYWYEITQERTAPRLIGEILNSPLDYPFVRIISPVYYRKDLLPKKTALTFSDVVLVKVEAGTSLDSVEELLRGLGEIIGPPIKLDEGDLYSLKIEEVKSTNALEVSNEIAGRSSIIKEARPNWIQLNYALHRIPNDTHYSSEQWALRQIGAPDGWDISTGIANVIVAILDTGCDLAHEDLDGNYVPQVHRYNALTYTNTPNDELGHGTCMAGIIAAKSDNNKGVAGVAWNCRIMPIKITADGQYIDEMTVIRGIDWAISHGANVINMSFGSVTPMSLIAGALVRAHKDHNIVLVASTGNHRNRDPTTVSFPARHERVVGVGASDRTDQRKEHPTAVGQPCWGSNYGPGLNVMAPGVSIWSTDIMTIAAGFNSLYGGQLATYLCLNTSSYGPYNGNYISVGNGTSASAPFVAGLAALLLSSYPSLSNEEVREIIEKTSEKVGGYIYSYDPSSHPNGTWNEEMGYGRINIARALSFAETYIKDSPTDNGKVPFTSEPFWNNSDIVIRRRDDNIFAYQSAIRGQENYVYVRVTNKGPAEARNVRVNVRGVAYVGTEFVYPDDWSATDSAHIQPTDIRSTVPLLPAGGMFIAKYSFNIAQIDALYGWQTTGWHPCILAQVLAENDYGTAVVGVHSWEHNNLAQRNISLSPIAVAAHTGARFIFPFIMGYRNKDSFMELAIEIPELPQKAILMFLDPFDKGNYFPALEGLTSKPNSKELPPNEKNKDQISILEGGQWSSDKGKTMIALEGNKGRFKIEKNPGDLCQMVLKLQVLRDDVLKDKPFEVKVSQISPEGKIVGGASFYFVATTDKS